jgi:thiol:disulfide interchange protein DsbC
MHMPTLARLARSLAVAGLAAGLSAMAPVRAQAPAAPAAPAAPTAQAAPSTAQIKAAVETWLQGRYKVDGVRRAPVAGMWEVQIGTDLIYVDDKGQHGFVEGQLIDLKSNRNLTQERVDELTAVNFKELPLGLALKQVLLL